MTTIYDLPKPTNAALKRSNALTEYLLHDIHQQGGLISFAAFMEAALYHPEFGYYNANTFALGARGDFTTASVISPLFAHCFAQQCLPLFSLIGAKNILEIGAGTGHFARDLLLTLKKKDALPEHYFIYEISQNLRKTQQDFLKTACPELLSRITWLHQLPTNFTGVIVANEVLDALPVHCFHIQQRQIKERCVAWRQDQFVWQLSDPLSPGLAEKAAQIDERYHLYDGYASEINLRVPQFVQSLANCLTAGVILFADYGYGQREYYHPERRAGSLTCFYKHYHHADPLIFPGLQDITAHVDFTQVAECAIANECTLQGYTSQAAFLLSLGLMDIAEQEKKNLNAADAFDLHQAIKTLTLPMEMGERVKIMALGKCLDESTSSLLGFQLQDRRWDL